MIKQLLSNIERNRVKWRKDVFESDSLSLGRKMAMQGVKDKIDQQAQVLQEEEIEIKEKVNYVVIFDANPRVLIIDSNQSRVYMFCHSFFCVRSIQIYQNLQSYYKRLPE